MKGDERWEDQRRCRGVELLLEVGLLRVVVVELRRACSKLSEWEGKGREMFAAILSVNFNRHVATSQRI